MGTVSWLQIAEPDLTDFATEQDAESNIKSVKRLNGLGFDPIERSVKLYARLEAEEKRWCELRDGDRELMDGEGNIIKRGRYSSIAHTGVLTQMAKINADLTRYMYGRVPEGMNFDNTNMAPFIIQLEEGGDDGQTTSPIA